MPSDFRPTDWTLTAHGDSRQRKWAARLIRACPDYERFWQHHVVPLTFRPHQADNYFIRPTQRKPLLDLADRSYSIFLHLTGVLDWSDGLLQKDGRAGFRPTDCAYYFFSHAYSLREAGSGFADAVNQVRRRYKCDPAFSVAWNDEKQRWEWGRDASADGWRELRDAGNDYRNALVHERPLFLQTAYLPARDRASIRELSGLAAIARLARDETSIDKHRVPAKEVVVPMTNTAARFCNALWNTAHEALSAIDHPKYREDQLTLRPEDRTLTLEKILGARNG